MSTAYDGDPNDQAAVACWSQDGGLTWSPPVSSPIVSYSTLLREEGDLLLLPYFLALEGEHDLVGPVGRIPAGTQTIIRTERQVKVTQWPRPIRREAIHGCRFVFNGQTLRLKNGLYFATLYGRYERTERFSLVAAVSEDGLAWRVLSTIADDACTLPGIEGPCESTTARLFDGRLMNVFRLESGLHYGQSWSPDEGRTWSPPILTTGPFSVEPSLMVMPHGVVALSGGRPGLYLWLDRTGQGTEWQSVNLHAHHNRWIPTEPIANIAIEGWKHNTTAYTELALWDRTNLLCIYDRIPGGHNQLPPTGVCNSVWVVRITVEVTPDRPERIGSPPGNFALRG